MAISLPRVTAIIAGLTLLTLVPAMGGQLLLGDGAFPINVRSWKEARYSRVVAQQYDFSCGSAAVATLLTYGYQRPTSEDAAFVDMFDRGDKDTIRKVGFSLLDMRSYLKSAGYDAEGYKVDYAALRSIGLPAITLITTGTYHHFVVIRGVRDETILLADPARGLRTVPRREFEKIWSGVLLVVRSQDDVGHTHFNEQADWHLAPASPVERAFDGQRKFLADVFLTLPLANEF